MIKAALAGHFMDSGTFKTEWDGVIGLIGIQEYKAAFLKLAERNEKCSRLGGNYMEKSQ